MYNKFEYFLNAVHYCLWLIDKKYGENINNIINIVTRKLLMNKYGIKYYERIQNNKKVLDKFFYDKEDGFHVGMANHDFGYFYSCYSISIGFVLFGFIYKDFNSCKYYDILSTICLVIPVGLGYIPAYKAVFKSNRYVKYFKKFEKKNEVWHKKWKRITIAFCVGAVVIAILGICAAFAIAIH